MNFGTSVATAWHFKNGLESQQISAEKYEANQLSLNMYTEPETGTVTLEQFHAMASKRLGVLRKLELLRDKFGSIPEEYRKAFREEIGGMMPLAINTCKNSELQDSRKEDRISHFILRLAFCQTPEQSEWFVRMETELFRIRFQIETLKGIRQFLSANGIFLNPVDVSERNFLQHELASSLQMSAEEVSKTDIYKVEFDAVLDLLAVHRVYLKDGIAYISSNDLLALILPRFRENISNSMAVASKQIGFLQENDRLVPLMRHIVQGGVSYRKEFQDPNAEYITPDMVDSLAQSSFPLCMRQIHLSLRREHHLRHFARRQYGLFLKGVGLSLEGALEFFKFEFTKKMDADKFAKEYAYNIRHMYGKEGSRIDQKPLSCATIILGTVPTAPDCHGCPFRHSEASHLGKQLEAVGLNEDQVHVIKEYSKVNRFDKACTKYFEYTHNVPELEEIITHPNQYYSLSRKVNRGEYKPALKKANATEEDEIME